MWYGFCLQKHEQINDKQNRAIYVIYTLKYTNKSTINILTYFMEKNWQKKKHVLKSDGGGGGGLYCLLIYLFLSQNDIFFVLLTYSITIICC